jgi:two-component system chemotaxis sensor kinase CheA
MAPDAELEAVSARITAWSTEMRPTVIRLAADAGLAGLRSAIPAWCARPSRQLGKRVDLLIEGGDIELDRAILDEIGDPLLHLLRNAVDHGIESPADRRKAGKPEMGRIVIAAARDRSGVAIRVTDDGRGIDRKKIAERAVKEGTMESVNEELTDDVLLG